MNDTRQAYEYRRPETGQIEEVAPERWRWLAIYRDGSELHQFDQETGVFHQFKEIDLENIVGFVMYSLDTSQRFSVELDDDCTPIHFYRNFGTILNGVRREFRWYMFGFQKTIEGTNHKVIFKIDENDQLWVGDGVVFSRLAISEDTFHIIA